MCVWVDQLGCSLKPDIWTTNWFQLSLQLGVNTQSERGRVEEGETARKMSFRLPLMDFKLNRLKGIFKWTFPYWKAVDGNYLLRFCHCWCSFGILWFVMKLNIDAQLFVVGKKAFTAGLIKISLHTSLFAHSDNQRTHFVQCFLELDFITLSISERLSCIFKLKQLRRPGHIFVHFNWQPVDLDWPHVKCPIFVTYSDIFV